jgi:hypothetical protein
MWVPPTRRERIAQIDAELTKLAELRERQRTRPSSKLRPS